jgi:hypothetical protein
MTSRGWIQNTEIIEVVDCEIHLIFFSHRRVQKGFLERLYAFSRWSREDRGTRIREEELKVFLIASLQIHFRYSVQLLHKLSMFL